MTSSQLRILFVVLIVGCSDYSISAQPDAPIAETSPEGSPDTPADTPVGTPADTPPTTTTDETHTGAVTGTICDPEGAAPVVFADVQIDLGGRVASTLTDADGQFTLTDLPYGTHTLEITRGGFQATHVVTIDRPLVELADDVCLENDRRFLVFEGDYDAVEDILDDLGIPYDTAFLGGSMQLDILTDPTALDDYEVILLNCGMDETWMWSSQGTVGTNLRQWVRGGGALYVSDWAFQAVEQAFPDAIDFWGPDHQPDEAYGGREGSFTASVLDPAMQQTLGSSSVLLSYDLPGWTVAEGAASTTEVLVEGPARTVYSSSRPILPLAMRFQEGAGQVLFTTFHNEVQLSSEVEAVLREMLLAL